MKNTMCNTMADWINQLADAHEKGKEVRLKDDPKDRTLGFEIDGTTYSIGIIEALRRGWNTPEGLEALKRIGFTSEEFGPSLATPVSRKNLVISLEKFIGEKT